MSIASPARTTAPTAISSAPSRWAPPIRAPFIPAALILQKRGQHNQAIEDFSTAISLEPGAEEPYNSRGVSYLASGDVANALEDVNRALLINDRYAEAWANQGLVYEQKGDKGRAFKAFARAYQLDNKLDLAREGMNRTRGGCPPAASDLASGRRSLTPQAASRRVDISPASLNEPLDEKKLRSVQRLDDVLDHLLGVGEQHHRVRRL